MFDLGRGGGEPRIVEHHRSRRPSDEPIERSGGSSEVSRRVERGGIARIRSTDGRPAESRPKATRPSVTATCTDRSVGYARTMNFVPMSRTTPSPHERETPGRDHE